MMLEIKLYSSAIFMMVICVFKSNNLCVVLLKFVCALAEICELIFDNFRILFMVIVNFFEN